MQEKIKRLNLGPADHHAAVCISRVRFIGVTMRNLLRKEGIWEDLLQELYATAFEAWKLGMDEAETRRYAQRSIYAFLKAYGFRAYCRSYVKPEKPFSSVFNFNIADRGLAPRYYCPMRFIQKDGDKHLDEKALDLLRNHPQGLTRSKIATAFQVPVQEVGQYFAPMIKQGKVVEIKRENTRGRPLTPLLVIIESGQTLPEAKMVKTEQMERIRRAYFVEGKSIKRIAREFHHCRRTVRKAIYPGFKE